ncbi:MAG TPA: FAD-binding oxidoreductase [Thermoprotei archaeon]|nr:FAD-binding oxidoreductase [Thermoprotei archaeon]
MKKFDVAVLGAGIAGLTTVYFSINEGFKTVLIDPNIPGREGSYNSVGILTRQLYTKREILLAIESISILNEIIPDIDTITYDRRFITIEDEKTAFQDYRFYRKIFTDVDIYYYGELPSDLSSINLHVNEAILISYKDLMVNTREVLRKIYESIVGNENLIEYRVKAEKISEYDGEGYTIYLENGETIRSSNVVLALGAWNKYFIEKNKIYLPISTYACIAVRLEINGSIPISGSDEVNYLYWMIEGKSRLVAGEYHQSTPITRPDKTDDIKLENREKSVIKSLMDRFKNIKELRLKEYIVGPCSFPIGKRPLYKELMKSLFLIDGLSGYGFTLAPALAKEAIDSITSKT